MDLEEIPGVVDVSTKRSGQMLEVNVTIEKLEFPVFEKVIQKELELYERFPNLDARFNVVPQSDVASVHGA